MKRLTQKEVLASDHKSIKVTSYGYTEKSVLSSHFEPFKNKRSFNFSIHRFDDGEGYLDHPWLILEENEDDLVFDLLDDGTLILDDPELFARPE